MFMKWKKSRENANKLLMSHLWEALAQHMKVTDVLLPRTFLFHPENLYSPLVHWFLVTEQEWLFNIFIWELVARVGGGQNVWEKMHQYLKESWWDGWRTREKVVYIWEINCNLTEGQKDLPEEEKGEQMKKVYDHRLTLWWLKKIFKRWESTSPSGQLAHLFSLLACSTVERFSVTNYGIYDSEPADIN